MNLSIKKTNTNSEFEKLIRSNYHKSRVFFYPLLNIRRGNSIIPIETYVTWGEYVKVEDKKFICLYHLRNDQEFFNFERTHLLGNKLFSDFKFLEGNKGAYIFNLKVLGSDWDKIIRGEYSKISEEHKKRILAFFNRKEHLDYYRSLLYPDAYYKWYSEIFRCDEKVLREVVELCPKIDFLEEDLKDKLQSLDLNEE